MLLLQTQLDLDPEITKSLELYGYFVAVIYTPNWFRAHVAAEAAANDLQPCKKLLSLEKKTKCSGPWLLLQYLHYKDICGTCERSYPIRSVFLSYAWGNKRKSGC